jgi:hypothetical protein
MSQNLSSSSSAAAVPVATTTSSALGGSGAPAVVNVDQKGAKDRKITCYGKECGKSFTNKQELEAHKRVSPACKSNVRGDRFRASEAAVHNYNAGCVVNNLAPSVPVAAPPAVTMPAVPAADAPVARVDVPRVQAEDNVAGTVPKHAPKIVNCDDNQQSRMLFRQKCTRFAIMCFALAALCALWTLPAVGMSKIYFDAQPIENNATFGMYDFKPDLELNVSFPFFESVASSFTEFFKLTNPANHGHVHALGVGQSVVDSSLAPFFGFCALLFFPTLVIVGMTMNLLRRRDYIRYTLIGCAYTQACWKGDVRSITMKTIPKSSPDFVPDAKYLVYRVSECRHGVQQLTKDVVISYSLYLAMYADTHTKKYTTPEKCATLLSDSFGFAAQCKQVNIAEELNADHDVTMNTCRFFAARLLSNRFGGGDLNCMRL